MTAYMLASRPDSVIRANHPRAAAATVYGPASVLYDCPTGCGWIVYVAGVYVDDLIPATIP